ESGTELALNETYDTVRNGARLILAYDAQSNSFKGAVTNTTSSVLERVRVEVHLSNGKELGPTTAADLGPGQSRAVTLTTTSEDFDGWSAHAEVGSEEHGGGEHGGEGRGEHDREGGGEHR
ncbi:MAG: FxLYD domain-containing protein, partial [Planctomycetota bacterium]